MQTCDPKGSYLTHSLTNGACENPHTRLSRHTRISTSSTFKSYLKKLSTLQNKAVKIVRGGKYYDRATQFYAKLRVLKLVDMVFF